MICMISDTRSQSLPLLLQLRKVWQKRYKTCVKLIKEMTSEELPKKQRKARMMKVSVNIPPDKLIGDEITFG